MSAETNGSEVKVSGAELTAEPKTLPADDSEEKPVSKKALKRLAKRDKWNAIKKDKRKAEKQRRKEAGLKNKCRGGGKRRRKFKKMGDSTNKATIVVDLSFDDLMPEKEQMRCANQVNRCYSFNRAMDNPAQFHVTSFGGLSKESFEKQDGFSNWDVNYHDKPYHQVFDKSKIIYLTSESHNVLTEVAQDKVYVIGGLVDHNSKKGLCLQLAEEKGIGHARLPLKEWVDMKTRGVLSINQVFNILADVSRGKSWQDSILNAIPSRKNAQAKQEGDAEDGDDSTDDDQDNEDDP